MVFTTLLDSPPVAEGAVQTLRCHQAAQQQTQHASIPTHMMHTVGGVPHHGLIVDLGASAGLMGVDTLRLFMDESLRPLGLCVSIEKSNATFTGVEP